MSIQGTDQWKLERLGSVGASRIHDVCAKGKGGGEAITRIKYRTELVLERLTGKPTVGYTNLAMKRGTELEPEARTAYEFESNVEVVQVGVVPHPTIPRAHASPDGFVGPEGLVEIKAPEPHTHLATLFAGEIDAGYIKQMSWQMAATDRKWCDWVSYCPDFPEPMRLFCKRYYRDNALISELELEARRFLAEVDATEAALRKRYQLEQAA